MALTTGKLGRSDLFYPDWTTKTPAQLKMHVNGQHGPDAPGLNYAGLVSAASMSVFQTEGASSNLVSCSSGAYLLYSLRGRLHL